MKENELLQKDFLTESEKESAKETKKQKAEPVKAEPVKKINRWIDNEAKGVKACPDCGKEIMGWAYRQSFNYCPWCGVENYRS